MARLPRLYHPNAATIGTCFYADGDYRFYLECLGEATRAQPAGQAAATDTLLCSTGLPRPFRSQVLVPGPIR